MIAMDTMARYMDRRSQERKVRSLAQWSRASEVLFSKTSAPERGDARKMCRFCWDWGFCGLFCLFIAVLAVFLGLRGVVGCEGDRLIN